MNKIEVKENKMGVMPVNKLLVSMSVPMMISMLVQACYNIVDSMFVSMLSENALTAVSMAFPIQSLMIAVGSGMGVGINSILSRSLGEKRADRANKAALNGLFIIMISYLIFACVGLIAAKSFMRSQTNIAEIVDYGTIYLQICCIFSFGMFGQMTFERLLQSSGKTVYTMFTQGLGAIINIILDPILIFGLFGVPKFGVAGAAIATVIGQCCACMLAIYFNLKKNKEISLKLKGFFPDLEIIKLILAVGVPSIVMQSIVSIMSYGLNKILLTFSTTAVAVFGVYFKLQSFVFMPVFGLNNALIPIVAYNYGAGNKERMVQTVKLGILYAVSIMVIGLAIFQIIPGPLLAIFNASEYMLEIGIPALRIISISFVFAGYCIAMSGLFQGLGNGIYSMITSITRQLVVILPVAYLFSRLGGLSMVWWAFPVSEIAAVALTTAFFIKVKNGILKKL